MQQHGNPVEEKDEALRAALERERRISETLQRALLLLPPDLALPFEATTIYEAALDEASVGGAFFDLIPLPEGGTALTMGTLNGKGLSAAAHVPAVKYALRAYLVQDEDPGRALSALNRYLFAAFPAEAGAQAGAVLPLSVAAAVIDAGQESVLCACAGENALRRISKSGDAPEAPAAGPPLGAERDARYPTHPLAFRPGDTLLLAVPGVWEPDRQRLPDAPSLRAVSEALHREARERAGGALAEDFCLVLARRPETG